MLSRLRGQTMRHNVQVRLIVRAVEPPGSPSYPALATNISAMGAYIATELEIEPGKTVEMLIRMPEQVSSNPAQGWRCVGRVVRVDPGDGDKRRRGFAVEFQYYELLEPEMNLEEALASLARAGGG